MAKALRDWLTEDVQPFRDKSVAWLSQQHFFRDPMRPTYSDLGCFFSPADGIILYQKRVGPDEPILDIKGRAYSLRDALRDETYNSESLVIGIFMTFYDVHVNRVPYPGYLSYRELEPIDTFNHPMLDVEAHVLKELRVPTETMDYLHHNQRMVNWILSLDLGVTYHVLQIADYDVDCITPFNLKQGQPVSQGERFSMIRYGSQVDLIVPCSNRFSLTTIQETGSHVEAGIDPVVRVDTNTAVGQGRQTNSKEDQS